MMTGACAPACETPKPRRLLHAGAVLVAGAERLTEFLLRPVPLNHQLRVVVEARGIGIAPEQLDIRTRDHGARHAVAMLDRALQIAADLTLAPAIALHSPPIRRELGCTWRSQKHFVEKTGDQHVRIARCRGVTLAGRKRDAKGQEREIERLRAELAKKSRIIAEVVEENLELRRGP